jgi:PKHD-type hydroxylase
MLLQVPAVLSKEQVERCRHIILAGAWADGRITAGSQSEQNKRNLQLPEDNEAARTARSMVLEALGRSALFFTAALPKKIYPPLFNRYEGASNNFGNHIDNGIRTHKESGLWVRTDLSATLFLTPPADYDGGELVVEDNFGSQSVKLAAGDLVLYPASSVHRVEPVTRGSRLAAFFWVESMVRDDAERRLLFDLDASIYSLRQHGGDTPETVKLTGCYHNLLRMWADV